MSDPAIIVREAPPALVVSTPGPQGPPGPEGPIGPDGPPGPAGSASAYRHVQGVAADTWVVVHNLGYRPGGLTIVDSAGRVVQGDARHVADDTVELSFAAPFSGEAYLS